MAYKLKFTGATATATIAERVDLTSSITLNASAGTNSLRVEIEFELDSLSATNTLCFAANFCRFQILNTGQISVQYRNQTNSLAAVTSATGVISAGVGYVLALELSNVDRNARIFLDGVQVGIVASRWGTFTVDRLGLWPENSTLKGSLYRVTCYQNGAIVNDYNPSIVLADPNILVDEIGGNNGTMINFPSDGSARVFYDDGGGSTEQITTSGGIVSTLAGCAASAQIINEQVLSASGIAAAVAAGIASAGIVNEQVNSSGGIASAIANAITSTSAINEQALISGGIAAAFAGATASTQVINEQTSEQIVSSGGIAASIGSASAFTQVIHEQVVSSGGVAAATATGVAAVTIVNSQVITASGVVAAVAGMVATTTTLQVDGIPDTSTPYLDIGADWVNVYAAANLPLGSSVVLQNVGATPLFLSATGTAPASNVGLLVMPSQHIEVASDVTGLFARSILPKGAAITARTRTHFSELRPLLIDSAPQPSAIGVQPVMYWGEATASWQTVQSLTGLAKGQQLVVQNIGDSPLYLASRNIPPSDLYDLVARPGELIEFNGPELLWLKTPANKGLFTAQPRSHFQFVRPVADLSYSMLFG